MADVREPLPELTPELEDDPRFLTILGVLREWKIAVPRAAAGFDYGTPQHAGAIVQALQDLENEDDAG